MLQYVTICYNMLQYVTICYNMLQYVTICYNMLHIVSFLLHMYLGSSRRYSWTAYRFIKRTSLSWRRVIVVIASAQRTEDPGFEFRQGVRFLGFYMYIAGLLS
jgi:hypothetical protein